MDRTGKIMRGTVGAVALSRAIAAASLSLAAGRMTAGKTGAGYVTADDPYCESCSDMSARQFRDALAVLRKTRDLRADVFVGLGGRTARLGRRFATSNMRKSARSQTAKGSPSSLR
jgi:hypothetical protein